MTAEAVRNQDYPEVIERTMSYGPDGSEVPTAIIRDGDNIFPFYTVSATLADKWEREGRGPLEDMVFTRPEVVGPMMAEVYSPRATIGR